MLKLPKKEKYNKLVKNTWAVLLILFLSAGQIYAFQRENPQIQSHLTSNFELRNQNWAVSQNPNNFHIYLANSEGLIEFNGISFERHFLKENLPVRSVLAHASGKVFTGSFEEFGYWEYNEKGDLQYTSLADTALLEKNDEIWRIFSLHDNVYFQSFTSIYKYQAGLLKKIKAPFTMLFLHKTGERFIAQIIDTGLFWFENDEFHPIPGSEILSNKKVHAIVPYDDSRWLICTDHEGLFLFDGLTFSYFNAEASDFLKRFTCNAAHKLSDSTFAFGSILNGLILTDKKGNIQRAYNSNNGLKNNTVLSLYVDSDKGLWAGLDEGVSYIDLLSPYTHYKSRNGTLGTIYALLLKNQILYIGTNHGLFRADVAKRGHVYHFQNLSFLPGSQGQVWTLEEIDGQIICGHNDGTFLIKGNTMQQISDITGGWTYKPFNDFVIAGTYTGIIILEKNNADQWQFRNKIEDFSEPTRYLEVDYLGYIWASHHQKGVFRIELSDDLLSAIKVNHYPAIENQNYNIKVFKINNRVVFTTGENIYTWDFVRNEIIEFETLNQHLDDFIKASQISHFKKNKYWFIREDKLGLFDVGLDFSAEKIIEIAQENVNLPQRRIQLVALDDNNILIPNPQNFDAYNFTLQQKTAETTRLHFDKLHFYGKRDTLIWFENFPLKKIPSRANNLTVYFSDPSDFGHYPSQYQYRIRELDEAWQSTYRNFFTYLDLKHGKYTLEIRKEASEVIAFTFTINKPWQISHIAVAVYILAFLALIWGLIVFFRFEISRQKELVAMEIKQNSLEKELDYKSYELMLTVRHLLLKDNILNELQKQILSIKDQSSKYPVKHIKTMESIINQGLGTQSVEWENALNNLKLSQQGFFKALKEKYPELTPNDMRLCSYLRMNFNTKEIAQLLNITTRGVEVSRHRLRKKLKLTHDDNLTEFLMSEEFNLPA